MATVIIWLIVIGQLPKLEYVSFCKLNAKRIKDQIVYSTASWNRFFLLSATSGFSDT